MDGLNLSSRLIRWCLIGVVVSLLHSHAQAEVRIQDITRVHGDRVNQLIGIGLVTGLNGTGGESPITRQVALNLEQRLGLRADPLVRQAIEFNTRRKTDNLSVVIVTADLPSFARNGSKIDVVVSAYDDASSLQGGVLVRTPLYAVDGQAYAVASGPVSVGGFSFEGKAAKIQQNHPTTGRIPAGATIEKETFTELTCDGHVQLILSQPSYETATRIATKINTIEEQAARALDPAMVEVIVPLEYSQQVSEWIGRIGSLMVEPDVPARVVINERTGTVIVGEHVKISRVLITHANLTITSVEAPEVSQPLPFSDGETTVVPRSEIGVTEEGTAVTEVQPNLTVGDLAVALNTLGVSPRDLSSIFQQLKESGALHAELILK